MSDAVPRVAFLYLRHGQTDWNAAGRAQGRVDVPLNGVGRAQAESAGRILTGRPIARIVASPLLRARQTAEIVRDRLGRAGPAPDLVLEEGLREVSFGPYEGEALGGWYEDWLAGRPVRDGIESFLALSLRAASALSRHLDVASDPSAPVLFVAHGALFRAIRHALGLSIEGRLANGVPLDCVPGPDQARGPWRIDPVG